MGFFYPYIELIHCILACHLLDLERCTIMFTSTFIRGIISPIMIYVEKYMKENVERFWKNITMRYDLDDKDNCWGWNGPAFQASSKNPKPFFYARNDSGIVVKIQAIRFAWLMVFGYQLDKESWLIKTQHDCNDPLCMNPHHRRVTTKDAWFKDFFKVPTIVTETPVLPVSQSSTKPKKASRIPTEEEFMNSNKKVH